MDGVTIYSGKSRFSGNVERHSKIDSNEICVTIEDNLEGFLYDVKVNNVPFHRLPRKSTKDLDDLRQGRGGDDNKDNYVEKTEFSSFTGKDNSSLDGFGKVTATKPTEQEIAQEESLIDLSDWDNSVSSNAPISSATGFGRPHAASSNPFDNLEEDQVRGGYRSVGGGYKPRAESANYVPGMIHDPYTGQPFYVPPGAALPPGMQQQFSQPPPQQQQQQQPSQPNGMPVQQFPQDPFQ